jgi:hypothetical protein
MKYLLCFVIIFTVSTSFLECKKSKAQSCGCDSPIMETYNSVIGKLSYNAYLKQYFILGGGNSIDGRENYICDTSFPGLQPFLDSARIFSPTVTFSGQVRNFCFSDTLIYLTEVTNISITQISY